MVYKSLVISNFMSATVELLASGLEEKGYKLKSKVRISVWKTVTRDGVDYGLEPEEKEFKRTEKEAIDNFCAPHILGSITLTAKGNRAKFEYIKKIGETEWVLKEMEDIV